MSTYTEVGTAAFSKRKHHPRLQLKNQNNSELQIWLYYSVKLGMFEDTFDLQALLLSMRKTNDVAKCLKLHEWMHFEMDVVKILETLRKGSEGKTA